MKHLRTHPAPSFFVLAVASFFALTCFSVSGAHAEIVTDLPYAHTTSTQTYKFPAISGSSTFDVISLPETIYSKPTEGSALFTLSNGTQSSSHYLNLAHTGRIDSTNDTFLLSAFTQAMCKDGVAQPLKERGFTTHFTRPIQTVGINQIQIRAYDAFRVTWGDGVFRVQMNRYWRVITLPSGKTADTFSPNDYFISNPRLADDLIPDVPDVASPETETFVLTYNGIFAPTFTRVGHGDPYESERFARPSAVLVNGQTNLDFNFWNIKITLNGETATPDVVTCVLNQENFTAPKVQPCGCLNNNQVLACGDPVVPFVETWPPFQFSLFTGADFAVKNIADLRDAISQYGDQVLFDPTINLHVNKTNPEYNKPFVASAQLQNFTTNSKDAYISWCVDGKTQQGLVAGGEKIEKTVSTDATTKADAVGCCNLATRTPVAGTDGNGDGIDDAWQKKYYYQLTGKTGLLLPTYDDDKDGYVADRFLDLNGERLASSPGSISSLGKTFTTGDGAFDAREEYIWGTSPVEYDTDQDGYPDEADIVGVGQTKLEFLSTIQPRKFPKEGQTYGDDRFLLSIKTIGRSEKKRDVTIDPATATIDSGVDLQNIVRVATSSRWFFAQDEGNLSLALTHTPDDPGLNSSVRVTAQDSGGGSLSTSKTSAPFYQWYIRRVVGNGSTRGDGKPNGTTPYLSGQNLQFIDFTPRAVCPQCQVGDQLIVSLTVTDLASRHVATAEEKIPVGAENSLLVFQDCDHNGSDEEVGAAGYCFRSKQVTNKVPVRVGLTLVDATNPSDYYFQWSLDNIVQSSNCLVGGQLSSAAPVRCGFGTSQMVFTPNELRTTHKVAVTVYKRDLNLKEGTFIPIPSNEVVRVTGEVSVGNPSVTIVFDPAPTIQTGYGLGDTILAHAFVEFLDPNPKGQLPTGQHALQYTWYDGTGGVIKTEVLNSLTDSQIAVLADQVGTFSRSVKVESPDYLGRENGHMVPVTGGATSYVLNQVSPLTLVDAFQVRLASILALLPPQVRVFLQVLGLLTLGGGVFLVILLFSRRAKRL